MNIEKNKEWIPRHLQTLVRTIISSELKQNSIEQCIIQAPRPKSYIQYLEADGNIVHIADGDADTMIVKCTLEYAGQECDVNVVAHDTDVM